MFKKKKNDFLKKNFFVVFWTCVHPFALSRNNFRRPSAGYINASVHPQNEPTVKLDGFKLLYMCPLIRFLLIS